DGPTLAVEPEDVLVRPPVRHHLLALLRLLDGADLVAQPRGLLEALGRRGLPHPALQRGGHLTAATFEQLHRLPEVLLVRAAVDREHARPEAALDVVLDAGAGAVAEHAVAAGPQRKDLPDGVERLPNGGGAVERPEVAAPVLDDP